MRAVLAVRTDPSLVIVARTPALKIEGAESLVARAKAYSATGVDAIHISGGFQKLEQIQAVYAIARLPIIVGHTHGAFTREELSACGVRIMLKGHQPVAAAVKAFRELYTHLFNGGSPADFESKIASARELEQLVNGERYKQWLHEYMR